MNDILSRTTIEKGIKRASHHKVPLDYSAQAVLLSLNYLDKVDKTTNSILVT